MFPLIQATGHDSSQAIAEDEIPIPSPIQSEPSSSEIYFFKTASYKLTTAARPELRMMAK